MDDDPCQYRLTTTNDDFYGIANVSRLDFARNASAGWLKDAISLKSLEWHQPSSLRERSHSCSGRIEASSAYAKGHTPKSLSFRTDRPNVSRSNSPPELVLDRHSRRSRSHEILGVSLHQRVDGSARKEKNKISLDEKHVLEYRAGELDLVKKHKNDSERATVLPLRVLARKVTKTCSSPVHLCTIIGKRHFGEEDEEMTVIPSFKKPRIRTKRLKSPVSHQNTMKSFRTDDSDPTFKPSPSSFQASKWSSIDRSVFEFASHHLTRYVQLEPHLSVIVSQPAVPISPATTLSSLSTTVRTAGPSGSDRGATEWSMVMPLLETQVRFKPEPSSFRTEGQSHPYTEHSHFVSALDKFNEIIPGDDASQRLQDNPNWCLANKKGTIANKENGGNSSRCRWPMPCETRNKIAQILAELADLNVYTHRQEGLDKILELASIAVCHHQRDSVMGKLKSLLQADRLKSSTQATPITSDLQYERSQAVDRSRSSPTDQESRLSLSRKGERAIESPVTTSAIKITYWLRELPSRTLNYLPEYRPYLTSELSPRSPGECVVKQAKEPLFIRNPRITDVFQELDERLDGFLYIYWNRASFGLVKIGCTTRDVDIRLREWEEKCGHLAEEHYRSQYRVKHIARIEKLIHTEFREYRVFELHCRGCGRKHIEWFKGLDLALMIERIEAWTNWIMKDPYEERWGVWRLKSGLEFELPQICATRSETRSPKKGNASIAKESPRHQSQRRRAGLSWKPS